MPRPTRRDWAVLATVTIPALWGLLRITGWEGPHPVPTILSLTPYAAALSVVTLVAAFALRARVACVPAAAVTLALVIAVLPRAVGGPARADGGDRGAPLTVMTSNLFGPAGDPEAVVRLVRRHRVDVLSLQELTAEALEGLDRAGIRRVLPERVLDVRPGASGSGLMARHPLRRRAAGDPAGQVHAQPVALVEPARGPRLLVKALHTVPPRSGSEVRRWRAELGALPGPRRDGLPMLLAGDFNATLDHGELRAIIDRGFTDAADASGDGLKTTWNLRRWLPGITIDHVLVPPGVRVRDVHVRDVPGSDHRAVIAELLLPHPSSPGVP